MDYAKNLVQSSLLGSVRNLRHGFTLRTLPDNAWSDLDQRTATVKQVHKAEIIWTETLQKRAVEADAVGTATPGLPVGVITADCSPILLATLDVSGRARAVMAVHAGWRGAAAGIAEKAVEFLWSRSPQAKLVASVGPTIGYEAYEVGEEVIQAFPGCEPQGLARFLRREGELNKYLFNLPGENARQIKAAAARLNIPLRIEILAECTYQNKARYHSYRRDGAAAGRMLSFVELT